MKRFAVIVAGGTGIRMGGGMPKQFRSLCGKPMLWWSMKAFQDENADTEIILVLPEDYVSLWQDVFSTLPEGERISHKMVTGGETRSQSVINGLKIIDEDDSLVAIHDAARPLVTVEIISNGWDMAEKAGSAIPVVAVTDSLRKLDGKESVTVDRKDFVSVQTPQVFNTFLLKEAYRQCGNGTFTDDASVVEHSGKKISIFPGDTRNMKVTNPQDLAIASVLMERYG